MTLHADQFADSTGLDSATSSQPGAVWRSRAACLGSDNAVFFPGKGRHDLADQAAAACESCPVWQECLDFAVDNRIVDGVWGGLTYKARQRYKKNRDRRALHGEVGEMGRPNAVETRTLTCRRCGTEFIHPRKIGAAPWYCSDLCRYEARLHMHTRFNASRKKGTPNITGVVGDTRRRKHGTPATYKDGCRCSACTQSKRSDQKKRRLAGRVA